MSSILHRAAFGLLFAAVVSTTTSAQDGEKLALITDLDGSVQVATAASGAFANAAWGTQLFEGDRIKTGADSDASLLFSNGNLIAIGENSAMTISAGPSAASSGSKPIKTSQGDYLADASDMTLYRAGAGEIGALGGLRSAGNDEQIEQTTPRNTRIKSQLPEFVFSTTGEFELFTVKVLSDDGVVWSGETEEGKVSYPEDAPKLAPGTRYFWQVDGEVMLNTVSSPLVSFEVLSDDELAEVEAGESEINALFVDAPGGASHLYVLGSFYSREGLLGDAIDAFSKLAEKHPEAARAQEILGKLYYDVDRKDDAVKALQKAVALEQ